MPLVWPLLLIAIMFRAIEAFRLFDLVYILTGGGPGGTTETLSYQVYKIAFFGFDTGRAAQNMMLAAWELGIGSVPATVYEHDRTRELLGYPTDQHCEYILSFGYPADPSDLTRAPEAGGRRDLDEMVRDDRW